ncbi:11898_t:CDS:2 [Entrophospora sp. SA101]|nr:11898_t:CDS:2 [Entrophospora sp. SA101]
MCDKIPFISNTTPIKILKEAETIANENPIPYLNPTSVSPPIADAATIRLDDRIHSSQKYFSSQSL